MGFYDTPGSAGDVAVAGSYVYVADGSGGLLILRFTGGVEPTPAVETLSPLLSDSDPVHEATMRGQVNPNGATTDAWFEWGTDPGLTTYTTTVRQTLGPGTQLVVVTATLTNLEPGAPYYYRVVAENPSGTVRGAIRQLVILLGSGTLPWNKYDRLIHYYAHQKKLPAALVKAVFAQESGLHSHDKPERAFRYEPSLDVGQITPKLRKGAPRLAPYAQPEHPPARQEDYPYSPQQGQTVVIQQGTTITQLHSIMPELMGWLPNCDPNTPNSQKCLNYREWLKMQFNITVAQYRLASSYGLGQVVYFWHGGRIGWDAPETFYDPYSNTRVATEYLAESRNRCTADLGENSLNFEAWKRVLFAYNGGECVPRNEDKLRRVTKYFNAVKRWFLQTQPIVVSNFDTSQVLPPPDSAGLTEVPSRSGLSGPGEYEVDRLVADVKGTGQLQLVVLSVVVNDPEVGVEAGVLKVFSDPAGTAIEWQSSPMTEVLAAGLVSTHTLPEGGAPLLVAHWGAGAHGTQLYLFRWNGQDFQPIPVIGPTGEQSLGFFGDNGVVLMETGVQVGTRGLDEPLNVSQLTTYGWDQGARAFQWEDQQTMRNIPYQLYLPLIRRNR